MSRPRKRWRDVDGVFCWINHKACHQMTLCKSEAFISDE